ncbi:MAG: DUF5117 domain-containing protein, partial [Catalinimonas sp.]
MRLFLLCFLLALPVVAQKKRRSAPSATATKTIAAVTQGAERRAGFLTLYWDERQGKLWGEIDRFDEPLLYYTSLAAGVGSNDLGLDRGLIGSTHVVEFRRVGPKVLMVEPNQSYRARSDNSAERSAVREAFAESVHWGFDVAAETAGRVLVDLTPFVLRDAMDIGGALARNEQGTYQLEASRSVPYLPRTKAFPKNTELEATLTFTGGRGGGKAPGQYVRAVVPTPGAITVRTHHSFVELPDGNYRPRAFDPRAGVGYVRFFDYAAPIDQPLAQRYLVRHRLQKRDPSAAVSDPVAPIIYYLDPGTPEPVRSALREGASWWAEAFEAAGFSNAFRVEMLPDSADPMDVRYNVIQWVHRATRGWSYGMSVVDPRTGEII